MANPTAPVPNRPESALLTKAETGALPVAKPRFDERHFFDRIEYVAYRLFMLFLALLSMYAVIKDHIK